MNLVVDLWDVGQGDCSVCRLPDNSLLVVDVGPLDSPIIEWLTHRKELIKALVITHNDEDHAGCLDAFLEKFHTIIETVFVLTDRHPTDKAAKRILGSACKYARKKAFQLIALDATRAALPIYGYSAGSEKLLIYAVHPDFVTTLHNQLKKVPKPNDVCAVLCLDVNAQTRLIWAGDAPMRIVADKCEGKSPQMMVGPHHGAPTDKNRKTYNAQFDRVKPEDVFVSVGTDNTYDHPIKNFIDQHSQRGRRVTCSQMVKCDDRRVEHGRHVMRQHLELGHVPPLNPGAVTCRGPIRFTWKSDKGCFEHDKYHAEHLIRVMNTIHRPFCVGGLSVHRPSLAAP